MLERGEGPYVFDTDGNRYFDGLSSLFCCQIGYSHGEEMAAAAAGQLSTLAFLAGRTERLRLLTSVMVVPQRHPVLTAKMLATIDILCGGRLIVGCGVGWLQKEFEALGAPPYAERGRATDEFLDAFKVLWTEDAPKLQAKAAGK